MQKMLHKALRAYSLPLTVLLTGGCVLVVEVVAVRILSPFYGNTIYAFSSIISVILAALSIGYYTGGRLADKYPSLKLFYGLIFASGLVLLGLHIASTAILPSLGRTFSITSGPLVASLLFFFAPALLLGMLSPFAVRLQKVYTPTLGVGSIAGTIFFWSTLGSIGGSLSAGFLLIPHFGVSRIMAGCGVLLGVLGLVPLIIFGLKRTWLIRGVLIFLALGLVALCLPTVYGNVLYSKDGLYEKVTIYDVKHDGHLTRYLTQDRNNSAAMYLDSDELVHEYTKYFALYKTAMPTLNRALVLGGGAYSVPKAITEAEPAAQVDVAEIEPTLYGLAQKYFKLQPSEHLHNYVEDGRRFLQDNPTNYDMIFGDVYLSMYSVPAHFASQQFYQLAKSRLSPGGMFVGNFIGDLSRQDPSFVLSQIRTMQSVFSQVYVFAVKGPVVRGPQNFMVIGLNDEATFDLQSPQVTASADPIIRNLSQHQVDLRRFDLSRQRVLTDDFAPVEYMAAQMVRRAYGTGPQPPIDGKEMMGLIDQQVGYGPRYPGSPGHQQTQAFVQAELGAMMPVQTQTWEETPPGGSPRQLTNIIGRLQPEKTNRIVLAAHYDTKQTADRDRDGQAPVPGANDGASGVAALLEVARALATAKQPPEVGIDFVFFDGEEGEPQLASNDQHFVPLGSTYFADHVNELYPAAKPQGGIVLDMICDKNLQLRQEPHSLAHAGAQTKAFWNIGTEQRRVGFETAKQWGGVEDDHTPLNRVGIPTFLVIDFDYEAWHTRRDTPEQCSAQSLESVAQTTFEYVKTLK